MNSKKNVVKKTTIVKEKQLKNKRKRILTLSIIFIILIVSLLNVIHLYLANGLVEKQLAELKCSDAKKTYQKLKKAKEIEGVINDCNYKLAESYYKDEKYLDAAIIYNQLDNYKDSYNKYNNIKKIMLENSKTGDYVLYGEFEQDGNNENGNEPIEWYVLNKNDNNILLISNYILNKMRFGSSYLWKKSEIREWLNNDFYNKSFTEEEQNNIQIMITSLDTTDKVFCLSAEEARLFFYNNQERIAYPTKKLINEGFKTGSGDSESGQWWTRSVSRAANGKGVVPVESNGNVRSAGTNHLAPDEYTYIDVGVRPVISLNLSEPSKEPLNMEVYGNNSLTDLDNEPDIVPSNSSSEINTKPKCNGGVSCRAGFHPCNPRSNGYCNTCCAD